MECKLRQFIRIILEEYTPQHSDHIRPVNRPHKKSNVSDEIPTMYKKDQNFDDDLDDHLKGFEEKDSFKSTFGPVPPNNENLPRISIDPYVRNADPDIRIG